MSIYIAKEREKKKSPTGHKKRVLVVSLQNTLPPPPSPRPSLRQEKELARRPLSGFLVPRSQIETT